MQPKTEQNVPIVLNKMSWQKRRFSVCSPSSEIMGRLSSLSSRNSFSGKSTGIKRPLSRLQASTRYHVICIQAGPGAKNKGLGWTDELCNNSCWEWEKACGWKWKIKPRIWEFGGMSCVALDQVRWLLTNPVKHLWTTACLTTTIVALSSEHLGIHAKKNLALLQIEHFK